ncbi:MAG TPA: type II toxin-antitoxin system RelE/ParE family toxin [Gammaproteobacteria bacterium]|nr:type II toxin-antitoxin system RelE/ParE family toxin [Gammaproteobacteria bacterium]
MLITKEYIDKNGKSAFAKWFDQLNSEAAARVTTALYRLERGHFSRVEGVGEGVFEYKIDFGPGYRIYFGKEGEEIIILLCGGSKKGQSRDIKLAKEKWAEYKSRKRSEV